MKLNKERQEKKRQHWQKIAISACEQCGQNIVPKINDAQSLSSWVGSDLAGYKLLFHAPGSSFNKEDYNDNNDFNILIGPEGGFTDDEVKTAQENNFKTIQFGNLILRTETAPIVALTLIQSL